MNIQKEIKPKIRFAYDCFLRFLGDLNGDFMIGLAVGVTVICMVLYRFQGLSYAMSPFGQFHIISVNLFFLCIPTAYYLLRFEKNPGKRALGSLLFPLIVFSLHDICWLIETLWGPQIYLDGIVRFGASIPEYSYHFSKNLLNLIPSVTVFLKYKFFKVNKHFTMAFIGMVLFHVMNIVFQLNLYILNGLALIIMETIDILPYLLLIKKIGIGS